MRTLSNFVGGKWVAASGGKTLAVENPATGETLCQVPLSTRQDLDDTVRAAKEAFVSWRKVPPAERARYLFRYKTLLDEHKDELAEILTREHGKTLAEALGSVRRGIENVEHACGVPTLMMGDVMEDVSRGIDCETVRQPLGVFAAVTPFNFPAMVPLWFWPYAVATGNTFIIKPSEQVPMSQLRQVELAEEAGFPPGVLSLIHGDKEVVEGILEHPDIAGVSFVGSTQIAKLVYEKAASHGKRVQALGGAKNHIVVMPDAEMDATVATVAESCFGCAGERCLAGSVVVAVGDVYEELRDRLVAHAREIVTGDGMDTKTTMGPVISARHKERVLAMVELGLKEGAKLLVDGRNVEANANGHFVGPCLFDEVTDEMTIAREEIFGPVMILRRAKDLDEAIAMIHRSEYANATSIFTQSGKSAREFRYNVGVSMIGVNIGVAAPMAPFPFGGTKSSFFGDTKAHGKDSIRFFTDAKVVISRWF